MGAQTSKESVVDFKELEAVSRKVRGKVLEMSHRAQTPHLGSALSCVDILVAAYWGVLRIDPGNPKKPDRDRFIFSKGHAVMALYSALAHRGFFPLADLDRFNEEGGHLPEQPSPGCVPGLEVATGSLGHGLPLGLGMALAGRIQKIPYRVFVLMSDGECNEGSVWEAALQAPARGLENVGIIIDYNRWQATGRTEEISALAPLVDKWRSFGWNASEVDGHDFSALVGALGSVPDGSGRPVAIVARTVKGKGVSFMEDDNNWHYKSPNAQELERALKGLGL